MQNGIRTRIARALPMVLALSVAVPVSSFAGFFGDHRLYMHALSDIRYARALIQRPNPSIIPVDERKAAEELDVASSEIKVTASNDWKPINDHRSIDTHLDRRGRFTEALKVLAHAHNDVCKEVDDEKDKGLRNRAVNHLDQAMNYIRQAMRDKRFDEPL